MFETAELGQKISKREYQQAIPELRTNLLRVQSDLRLGREFAVVILIAGVDGAGKGRTVNVLHTWMDPRYLETHVLGPATTEEAERPPMWRFWRELPPRGRIGIFFGSWITQPILRRVYGETDDADLAASIAEIEAFERLLVDSGVLLLKFWFHLSKKAQKKRLKALRADPDQAWRVSETERKHFKMYDTFEAVSERLIRQTSTAGAPWIVVEGVDSRYRELTVGRHILHAVGERLDKPSQAPRTHRAPALAPRTGQATILDTLDLDLHLDPEEYRQRLATAQARLNQLGRQAWDEGVSAIALFEGWDAAGKGGAIRRVTEALDARFYGIVPVAAPSDEELAQPYLWRFWRQLPRAGRLRMFDRSWYGRVLVERVEGFASPDEWHRAYREINDFERLLHEHGYGLAKIWMHIDKDEQARRFAERERTPYKQYKITDEDYRNRERWDLYEDAVNEMVERTSTSHAPWTLVEANDKRYARVKIVEVVCAALEDALARAGARRGDAKKAVKRSRRGSGSGDRPRRRNRG